MTINALPTTSRHQHQHQHELLSNAPQHDTDLISPTSESAPDATEDYTYSSSPLSKENTSYDPTTVDAFNEKNESLPTQSHSPASSNVSVPPRQRRSGKVLRWCKVFLRGPRPRAQLTIKHFKWWPLRPIEDAWLRITMPVAWKDVRQARHADLADDIENRRQLPQNMPLHPRSVGLNDDGSEDTWWNGVKSDVRLNWLHWCILALTFIGWVVGFSFLCKSLWYEGSVINQAGKRSDTTFYGCTTTFWQANSKCGFDGSQCSPFSVSDPYDFRCPSSCQTTTLGGQRAVGDQLPNYVPLVVGGGNASLSLSSTMTPSADDSSPTPYVYRGDSFICSAAIHAGAITSNRGGCGRLLLNGAYSGYEGVERHGITSTPFNTTFPLSFYFDQTVESEHCQDRRMDGYILNVILLAFVGFVLRPKSIVFFYTLVCVGFWHINFLSEPRDYPMSVGSVMGDFLPTLFVSYALWRLNFRFTLSAFTRFPLESNVWIQGFYWIGVLLDVVFANVPLNRLVASDINDQPGALTSLIVIVVIVVILAINQVRVIRKTGELPKYLALAIVGGILVGLLAAVPTTGFRLHHYIIALVLLPFCAFETRLSLIYSALLLGVFLNGVGRWGYDGIIQDVSTIRGSGTSGSTLPSFLPSANWTGVSPFVTNPSAITDQNVNQLANAMNGSVHWQPVPANLSDSWNAFQLLVDDVLRVQANETSYDVAQLVHNYIVVNATTSSSNNSEDNTLASSADTQTNDATQLASLSLNYTLYPGGSSAANILGTLVDQPHYLRLAYYNTITGDLGDFTNAATVWFNGTFIEPEPGRT